jgi:hemoglobin
MSDQPSLYERVGGEPFFSALVERFYDSALGDAEFMAMYPTPDDLAGAKWRLTKFLVQYWGGPTTYSDERGHPALRMRHAPFLIDEHIRNKWMRHMSVALADAECTDELKAEMFIYFNRAADHLINAEPPDQRDLTWRLTE